MEEKKDFGMLGSSADPTKLGNTARGIILAMSGIIIYVATQLGFSLAETDVALFAQEAGTAIGFLWVLYGIVQKLVLKINSRFFSAN